jgi:predicted ATPase/DNA-binding SARP family transcriptional activator
MERQAQQPALWHIDLLGRLRAASDSGQRIEHFQTRQTASLFAYLVFQTLGSAAPHAVPREVVAEMLWPGTPPEASRKRLAQALSWLRRRLEPEEHDTGTVLEADRLSIRLRPETLTTDITLFLASLALAEAAPSPSERMRDYEEAAAHYPGELLPGFYDDWILRERERLTGLYLGALHYLITHCEPDRALHYAYASIAADPFHETGHESVVRLLALTGQSAAALRHYRDWERRLKTTEGRPPLRSLRALAERIRSGESPVPPPLPVRPYANPLPSLLTPFFGREAETAQITTLLRMPGIRLVTLTGMGGVGKTRLAIEAARHLRDEAPATSVLFVPLADLTDAVHIPTAVAEALYRTEGEPGMAHPTATSAREFLAERLRNRSFLLVLDNLEHLLRDGSISEGAIPFVRQLLEEIPSLSLLVTSRQRLALPGEQEFPVPPLSVSSLETTTPSLSTLPPSVLLFADRAQAVQSDFRLTEENVVAVTELCTRLEGIPLALELCAAWTQVLTPTQMLEKLERRFDLLVSRGTDSASRHRTLRATLEYGYLLLPLKTKQLFARLSLFQGGWSLAAAETICGTDTQSSVSLLASLTELRERAMIVADEKESFGERRFRMLETLREFATEHLARDEAEVWRRRHADYFLHLAEKEGYNLSGPEQRGALNVLETEHDNLRAALNWSLTGDPELGMRLAAALAPFWDTRGHLREGRDWLTRLLRGSVGKVSEPILARAWSALGRLAWSQGDFGDAIVAHETALGLWRKLGNDQGVAQALFDLGATMHRKGEANAARAFVEESLPLAERCGDQALVARALNQLGNAAFVALKLDQAETFYQRALALSQARGDRQYASTTLHNLGSVAGLRGDHALADTFFQDALAIRRDLRDDYGVMTTLGNIGKNAFLAGRLGEVRAPLIEAIRLARDTGRKLVLSHVLKDLGLLEIAEGKEANGVRILAAVERLCESISAPMTPRNREEFDTARALARKRLGAPTFEALWVTGWSESLPEMLADLLRSEEENVSLSPLSPLDDEEGPLSSIPTKRQCGHCGSMHVVRHGRAPNGKQKYRCQNCGRATRENPGINGYDEAARAHILAVYNAGGVSLRELTRRFGVSRNTVLAWRHSAKT